MSIIIHAIYEGGVFRPTEAVEIPERLRPSSCLRPAVLISLSVSLLTRGRGNASPRNVETVESPRKARGRG